MSHRQYGTLKYIRSYEVHTDYVGQMNLTTLGSLLQRGWIVRNGTRVALTEQGEQVFEQYNKARVNLRKNAGEVSERVSRMLNLKSLHVIKRSA